MTSFFKIWCDGSFRHGFFGAGWVRGSKDGDAGCQGHSVPIQIESYRRGDEQDIAEVSAVAVALQAVRAGSVVHLHMDCQNVMDWVEAGRITARSKRGADDLAEVFERVVRAKAQLSGLKLIYASDRESVNMRRAHELSQLATNPSAWNARNAHQNSKRPARPGNFRI